MEWQNRFDRLSRSSSKGKPRLDCAWQGKHECLYNIGHTAPVITQEKEENIYKVFFSIYKCQWSDYYSIIESCYIIIVISQVILIIIACGNIHTMVTIHELSHRIEGMFRQFGLTMKHTYLLSHFIHWFEQGGWFEHRLYYIETCGLSKE